MTLITASQSFLPTPKRGSLVGCETSYVRPSFRQVLAFLRVGTAQHKTHMNEEGVMQDITNGIGLSRQARFFYQLAHLSLGELEYTLS
jgi:hypothetical protein